jgi:phosphate uptake regulator/8-oxo-dGTP pyrophosphatase MutT (NUDIX family)
VPFEPFRAAVAVYGILRDGDRLLLLRRAGTGYRDGQWSLPAGHLDGGEDAVSGLVRELREELGIEADPDGCRLLLVMHSAAEDAEDSEYVNLFFAVDRWAGEPRIAEPDKCSDLRWTDPGAMPADVVDHTAEALAAIERGDWLVLRGWDAPPAEVQAAEVSPATVRAVAVPPGPDRLDGAARALVTMARAIRQAVQQASTALLTADAALAKEVTLRDAEVEVLLRVVEDRLHDAQEHLDLREAFDVLQVAADLRRMGSLAVHIARATLRRHPAPAVAPELAELFRGMSAVAADLADKIVTVLSDRDAELAAQLDRDDDAMDHLHRQLFTVLLSPDWPLGAEAAIDGALLGRYYERYADHAVNIGHRLAGTGVRD